MYLSVHNFGASYYWDESVGCFRLEKAEGVKEKVL